MKKAYIVHDGNHLDFCLLVYSDTAKEAKKAAFDDGNFNEYIDIRVERFKNADKYAKLSQKIKIEDDYEILRKLGWRCEGDLVCDSCELYEMDGLVNVCDGCYRCTECGCNC